MLVLVLMEGMASSVRKRVSAITVLCVTISRGNVLALQDTEENL